MINDQEVRNKTAWYFVVAIGISLIVLGLLVFTSERFVEFLLSAIFFWEGSPPAQHWLGRLQMIGMGVLLCGIVVVPGGWFAFHQRTSLVSLAQKNLALLSTAIIAVVVLWLPVVFIGRSAIIAGERYWWLGDDAMISMRYARNLANGLGLVWNSSGEIVEGYSNILWTI